MAPVPIETLLQPLVNNFGELGIFSIVFAMGYRVRISPITGEPDIRESVFTSGKANTLIFGSKKMPATFKRIKSIGAFVVVMSMICTSTNAASLQMPTVGAGMPIGGTKTIDVAEAIQVAQHRGHGKGSRQWPTPDHSDRHHSKSGGDWNRGHRRVEHDHHGPRYKNGHRGYRDYRENYRRDDSGWWFPLAAFALGAAVLSQQNNGQTYSNQALSGGQHVPARDMVAHDNWCAQKYRSYSRTSKTYQPYNGPRKYCDSPYDNN